MSLRVVTYNLKDFFEPRTAEERPIVDAKIANVAALLRRADADVVALQEVASSALLDRLVRVELADLGYATVHAGPPDKRGIGNAIATRLPVLERDVIAAGSLPFPKFCASDADPYAAVPLRRAVVHLAVDAGAIGRVDVVTVHFKSRLPTPLKNAAGEPIVDASPAAIAEANVRSWVMRAAEATHVRRIVDAWQRRDPGAAVVVLGDFNDGIGSIPVRIVRGAFYGVDPAQVLLSATDRVAPDRRFSILHGGVPDLIDHILSTAPLAERLAGAEILNEALRDHGPYSPDAPIEPDSDHAPVVAWFAG